MLCMACPRRLFRHSTIGSLVFFAVAMLIVVTVMQYMYTNDTSKFRRVQSNRYIDEHSQHLGAFVLSDRESFSRREKIRKSWGLGQRNLHFIVGKNYCAYPPEYRLSNACLPKINNVSPDIMKSYLNKQDEITRRLQDETDVILVSTGNDMSEVPNKVTESLRWALKSTRYQWFLHIEDKIIVEMDKLEKLLKSDFFPIGETVVISCLHREQEKQQLDTISTSIRFKCGVNHILKRPVVTEIIGKAINLISYIPKSNEFILEIPDSMKITSADNIQSSYMSTDSCNMSSVVHIQLCLLGDKGNNCLKNKDHPTFENPSIYLNSDRFDVVVKVVYAYFYSFIPHIPKIIKEAYVQHIKVWNGFKEYCKNLDKVWFDAHNNCTEKSGQTSFVDSFQNTIQSIKELGFNSSTSRIPVDKKGFLLNGAHRLAAALALSKPAVFDHQTYTRNFGWGYGFFKKLGLPEKVSDVVILEWMKLQTKFTSLQTSVSMVSVFSNNHTKDKNMLEIVKKKCSKDNGILYEKSVSLTKNGARQLIIHMYGKQSWLEVKIEQLLKKFGSKPILEVLVLFIYGKENSKLVACKEEIRKLYNDKVFKSTAHIPDSPEENLILAKMILNPNSLQFMNHAKDPNDCNRIATELGQRSSLIPIRTLPGIYQGRDDIMIDSGTVLGFYGIRNRTDVDLLFLQDIDKSILGNKNGIDIQAHAFKSNSISKERPWGEDHFNQTGPSDQWDLFYDHKYYGYCYGMKFVSLEQMIRYKVKRNEPNKDQRDVRLLKSLLEKIK